MWGAGKFGQYMIQQLRNRLDIKIRFVIDKRADDIKDLFGIAVVTPAVFKDNYINEIDAVLVAYMKSISHIEELRELGVKKLGIVSDLVYVYKTTLKNNIMEDHQIIWDEDLKREVPILSILETNVVDYCNLNCKGCSHFSNIFPRGSKIMLEIFKRDIQQLSKKVNIILFNLLGGEVLLSEELEDYILCLTEYMPMTKIQLVTNGILIPTQTSERLQFLANNNIYVSITEYPPTTKMKDKISETLTNYGIYFSMRSGVLTFGKNIDISGKNDPWVAQRTCRESRCHFLRDGKIYKCPFSGLGNYFFKHYELPLHFDEGIDIYNRENDWNTIIEDLENKPIEQCKFCGEEERFPWAVSLNPIKEEWII